MEGWPGWVDMGRWSYAHPSTNRIHSKALIRVNMLPLSSSASSSIAACSAHVQEFWAVFSKREIEPSRLLDTGQLVHRMVYLFNSSLHWYSLYNLLALMLYMFHRKHASKLDELQKESEHKRYRNLPPRDRLRMKKQQQADEEAKRIALVTVTLFLNECLYNAFFVSYMHTIFHLTKHLLQTSFYAV